MPSKQSQKAILTILVSVAISVLIILATLQIFAGPDLKPSNFLGFNSSSSTSNSSSSASTQSVQSSSSSSTQSSSTSSSSSSQSSSSASSTSSSASSSSSSQNQSSSSSQNTTAKVTKTYTNQYFPDLKLVYPEDWKFETNTKAYDIYLNLVSRTVTLSKNQSKLTFNIAPVRIPSGCGGPASEENRFVSKTGLFNRFKTGSNDFYYSTDSSDSDCSFFIGNTITSNIKVTDVKVNTKTYLTQKDFLDAYKNIGQNVVYNYSVSLISSDPSEIQEVDQIVANSVFK